MNCSFEGFNLSEVRELEIMLLPVPVQDLLVDTSNEYGNSWFNKRENDDTYNIFRYYVNKYYRDDDADDEFTITMFLKCNVSISQAENNDPVV